MSSQYTHGSNQIPSSPGAPPDTDPGLGTGPGDVQPTPVPNTIVADIVDDYGETDSACGGDELDASSTVSIASSIRRYRTLHGRTFHNYNTDTTKEYWGPNDETMNEQLDIGHHMLTYMLDGKLFLAPIGPNPQRVLDVGTGTGIWAIDFADQHPSAEVIGTDISPTQPLFVPPNLKFELNDAQLEWTYRSDSFDYIHVRCLLGAIGDWAHVYREMYRCTKPGGYIEHLEISLMFKSEDGSVGEDHFMAQWSKTLLVAAEHVGKTFAISDFNCDMIMQAGFIDIVEKKYKVPVGRWPRDLKMKELGQWNMLFCLRGLESWSLYLLSTVLKWSYEKIQLHNAMMRNHMLNRRNHAYYDISVVYGRKSDEPTYSHYM